MSRLKVKINCVECQAERLITQACLSLVKRCKPCQKIFNREKARNRYRALKGIPLDKPVENIVGKKKKKEEPTAKPLSAPMATSTVRETPKVVPSISPEEQEKRSKALDKLFNLIADDSTTDDW